MTGATPHPSASLTPSPARGEGPFVTFRAIQQALKNPCRTGVKRSVNRLAFGGEDQCAPILAWLIQVGSYLPARAAGTVAQPWPAASVGFSFRTKPLSLP